MAVILYDLCCLNISEINNNWIIMNFNHEKLISIDKKNTVESSNL